MKLRISLVLLLLVGVQTFLPVSPVVRTEASPKIENPGQKCIITLRDKNGYVNVRVRPDVAARIVGKLRDGVYVNVTKRKQGWVYINGSDQGRIKGWLPEIYISC